MARSSEITRKTKETDITLSLALDGEGNGAVNTGIGFFDHMLEGFAKHGLFDLQLKVKGDLQVDAHHTVEDTGIVLGNAIREAFGDKKGIKRYGSCILPMDDALCLCALDLCGRPYFSYVHLRYGHVAVAARLPGSPGAFGEHVYGHEARVVPGAYIVGPDVSKAHDKISFHVFVNFVLPP